jgi:hypothetical protein
MPGQNQLTFGFVNTSDLATGQLADACARLTADVNGVVTDLDADIVQVASDLEEAVAYTPANVSDWNGSAPTSLQDALDRIAAFVGPVT